MAPPDEAGLSGGQERSPTMSEAAQSAHAALVARTDIQAALQRYLRLAPNGAAHWVDDPETATPFASMRDAMHTALRLPAALRAFGLPVATAH
jgi:hypothetical protein